MPVGYLVTLGDDGLGPADTISGSPSSFSSAESIGTGSWEWSGVWSGDGNTYSNVTDTGTYFYGTDGNTYFVPDNWFPSSGTASSSSVPSNTRSGTSSSDSMSGTNDDDVIYGGDGDDYLVGFGGNDLIFGGDGNDNYDSDLGDDTFYGEGGDDWVALYQNMEGEHLYGGETSETLGDMLEVYGDFAGVDVTVTFTGDGDGTASFGGETAYFWEFERFFLHSGDDTLDASVATSSISVQTGDGDNLILGGAGDDTLDSGAGDDTIDGGDGDDMLVGGAGDDVLTVGVGDTAQGGDGADVFHLDFSQTSSSGSDTVTFDGGSGDGAGTDYDTIDLSGRGKFALVQTTDADGDSTSGTATYDDGRVVQFSEMENVVTCFTTGSLIQTDHGDVPVEDLVVGDLVQTLDHGLQPVRWIGRRNLQASVLAVAPNLRPIRVSAGALGNGTPFQTLTLSPQHRVLVSSKIAGRIFDAPEVLIPVKKLVDVEGVDVVEDAQDTTYFHLLFDQHEVIVGNGLASESFFLGPQALKALSPEAYVEVLALFPDIANDGYIRAPARPIQSKTKLIKNLLRRHARNNHPLCGLRALPA